MVDRKISAEMMKNRYSIEHKLYIVYTQYVDRYQHQYLQRLRLPDMVH